MQKIIVTGRLTKDAQRHQGNNGGEDFLTFSVASNRRVKGDEQVNYYDVICNLTRRMQGMAQYLKKGTAVYVTGDFSASLYDRNNGGSAIRLAINADSVEFNDALGKKDENNNGGSAPASNTEAAQKPAPKKASKKTAEPDEDITVTSSGAGGDDDVTDDLPF